MLRVPRNPLARPVHADYSTVESVSRLLIETAQEIEGMTEAVATARQCREYDSDLRKRALAKHVREFLISGDSATAAETKGRGAAGYGEELTVLGNAYAEAERVVLAYEAAMVRWKSAQSLLSSLKAIAQI